MSDIAPRQAGVLFGLCNTFGSFAGILGVSGAGGGGSVACSACTAELLSMLASPRDAPPALPRPALEPAVCGFVLERTGSFAPIFQATAALYVVGTAVFNLLCRADPQFG